MSSLNKVMIIGRLGKDPETRYMPNGKAVSNISVATSEKWKDKETGDQKEKTEWHRVVAFDKLAEIITEYARKGTQCYVEGKIKTRKWQDKEGKDQYTTEIEANTFTMLGSRPDGERAERPASKPAQSQQRQAPPPADSFDDSGDIPF